MQITLIANVGAFTGIIILGSEIQQSPRAIQAMAIHESTNIARQKSLVFAIHSEANQIGMIDQ